MSDFGIGVLCGFGVFLALCLLGQFIDRQWERK